MRELGIRAHFVGSRFICPGLWMRGPAAGDYILSSQPGLTQQASDGGHYRIGRRIDTPVAVSSQPARRPRWHLAAPPWANLVITKPA